MPDEGVWHSGRPNPSIKERDLVRSEAVLSRWTAGFTLAIAQSSRKILICKTNQRPEDANHAR